MATTRVESQRARVLDAVERVVAERGYANATVAALCWRAQRESRPVSE